MMTVFEVHLAPGADPSALLTEEARRETNAQIMTLAEARAVGFSGLPTPAETADVRLVAVSRRDRAWIHRALETSEMVSSFQVYEVD